MLNMSVSSLRGYEHELQPIIGRTASTSSTKSEAELLRACAQHDARGSEAYGSTHLLMPSKPRETTKVIVIRKRKRVKLEVTFHEGGGGDNPAPPNKYPSFRPPRDASLVAGSTGRLPRDHDAPLRVRRTEVGARSGQERWQLSRRSARSRGPHRAG